MQSGLTSSSSQLFIDYENYANCDLTTNKILSGNKNYSIIDNQIIFKDKLESGLVTDNLGKTHYSFIEESHIDLSNLNNGVYYIILTSSIIKVIKL